MGSLRRKTFTKPLPDGAELFTRKGETFARWKDAAGKTRTAPVTTAADGSPRIVATASTYTAKYRDGAGHIVEASTGCRDKAAAAAFLHDLEVRADKVRSKLRTAAEDAIIDNQQTALSAHVAAFLEHQQAKGITQTQIDNTRSRLTRIAADCHFKQLSDLNATPLERWLVARQGEGMGAATRNGYREAWVTFGNWAVRNQRLLSNPFAAVPKADAKSDPKRKRRALTEAELVRLLDVARRRPLLDTATVRRGRHRGEQAANLRPETVARLDLLGRERALMYKTLVLTGLRKGELASLTVASLDLDAEPPYLTLDRADEKNREGNSIPLRSDLAADLRQWLADKATARQEAARNAATVPFDSQDREPPGCVTLDARGRNQAARQDWTALPADTPVFDVPAGLLRILNRDLRAAGIPKRDDRDRTVDVHALRHSFGTHLSRAGVEPRTAQAAMRHSDISLTMNVYTDPRLLDIAGAVERLPDLPLDGSNATAARATGTDGEAAFPLAPMLAPSLDDSGISLTIAGNSPMADGEVQKRENPDFPKENRGFSDDSQVGVKGFEPSTSWSRTNFGRCRKLPESQTTEAFYAVGVLLQAVAYYPRYLRGKRVVLGDEG